MHTKELGSKLKHGTQFFSCIILPRAAEGCAGGGRIFTSLESAEHGLGTGRPGVTTTVTPTCAPCKGEPRLYTKLPHLTKCLWRLEFMQIAFSSGCLLRYQTIGKSSLLLVPSHRLCPLAACPSSFPLGTSCAPWRILSLPGHCENQLWTSTKSRQTGLQ